jgi:RsiW-degrading membrane proteinase PrsW (M82 family)
MSPALALAGLVPAIVAMAYFDRLDKLRPEPIWSKRKVMLAGCISVIPCIFVEQVLMQLGPSALNGIWQALAYQAFVVAAFTEELAKVACVKLVIWRRPEFDERLDGIVYGTRAGLGFAAVENVAYLWGAGSFEQWLGMFVGRALLAIPLHAITAGIMGYYAARQRFDKTGPGLWGGFFIAVALHGLYDVGAFAMPLPAETLGIPFPAPLLVLVPIGCVVFGARLLRRQARVALELDNIAHARVTLPPRLFPFTFPS